MSHRATGDQIDAPAAAGGRARASGRVRHDRRHELLSWFGVRELDLYAQEERIQDAFDVAGITATPSLREAGQGGYLVVSRRVPKAGGTRKRGGRLLRRAALWIASTVGGALITDFVVWALGPERQFDHGMWHVTKLTSEEPSSCEDVGWLREVKRAEASANYENYESGHEAGKSTDGNRNTAWIQYLTHLRKLEVSDLISWTFTPDEWHVRLVCIRNGWAQNYNTFTSTGRLARIRLTGLRDNRTVCKKRSRSQSRRAMNS